MYSYEEGRSEPMTETQLVAGYGDKADSATLTLREMIARGELLPGQHLRQDRLAQQVGTTRVPVREAFKTLVAEGLLVHRRNEGHFVVDLSSHELHQLCWLRSVLEDELARTARWPDAALLTHLRGLNDRIRALGPHVLESPRAIYEVIEIDLALHLELWNLSEQKVLTNELLRAWRIMGPYRMSMGYTPQVVEEEVFQGHATLLDALERQDRDAYRSALARHLNLAYRVVDFLREQEAIGSEEGDGSASASAS